MEEKKSSLLKRYEDPTGEFSNRSLQMATWYTTHREFLRKLTILILVVWSALTLGGSLFFIGKYFIFDYSQDQENLKNLSYSYISPSVRNRFEPESLVFTSPQLFSGIENHYDAVVGAVNPNTSWIATVTYRFRHAEGATDAKSDVVLPGQERPLAIFGYEFESPPSSIEFEVVSIEWQRVDPHTIPDPQAYISQRIDVSHSESTYIPGDFSSGSGSPVLQFSVTNHSLFDFWDYPFILEFERAGQVTGITPFTISQFKGGETRDVSFGVLTNSSDIDSIRLIPIVNVFDEGVYMRH